MFIGFLGTKTARSVGSAGVFGHGKVLGHGSPQDHDFPICPEKIRWYVRKIPVGVVRTIHKDPININKPYIAFSSCPVFQVIGNAMKKCLVLS